MALRRGKRLQKSIWYPPRVSESSFDVAVIGGGPAGSTMAIYLRRLGYHPVLFEKSRFPRFHIGESLLPENLNLFEDLGIADAIRARGYPKKLGAEFVSRCGQHVRKFYFRERLTTGQTSAYQVLRSDFDHLLLERAREAGTDVREESAVTDVVSSADGHEIAVTPEGGKAYRVHARFLVDASGQETFLANRLNLKRVDPVHRRFAVFSHYRGVDRDPGDDGGNILIIPFGDGHWFWFIPLASGITSIGMVVTKDLMREHRDDIPGYFFDTVAQTQALRERMTHAEIAAPIRTIVDYSYESTRFAGDRFLIIGDAAAFLDPVFSSGVLMAMSSARDGARAIHAAFQAGDLSQKAFRRYERDHRHRIRTIFRLIRAYYHPAFLQMFLNPSDAAGLKTAVTTILAGNTRLGWGLRWRLELFYFIGWLRGRLAGEGFERTGCSHGCSIHTSSAPSR